MLKRTPIKQIGKKGRAWINTRASLKKDFQRWGITSCEIRFGGCWNDNALGFAHVDKRKNLGEGELTKVVLACNPCHDVVEKWPSSKMREFLEKIIKDREDWLKSKGIKI